jgi:hypothetical protein
LAKYRKMANARRVGTAAECLSDGKRRLLAQGTTTCVIFQN